MSERTLNANMEVSADKVRSKLVTLACVQRFNLELRTLYFTLTVIHLAILQIFKKKTLLM